MQIHTVCPSCNQQYRVKEHLTGRVITCRKCKTAFEAVAISPDTLGSSVRGYSSDSWSNEGQVSDINEPEHELVTPSNLDVGRLHRTLDRKAVSSALPDPKAADKTSSWQHRIKQRERSSPFGPLERCLMYVAAFLILAAIALNILPLFGVQPLGAQVTGRPSQITGLFVGLFGALLLAASLRRFRTAALLSSTGATAFLGAVFFLAVSSGDGVPGAPSAGDDRAPSPWIGVYPDWVGLGERGLSIAEDWQRFAVPEGGFSLSYPMRPRVIRNRIRIARRRVEHDVFEARADNLYFLSSWFEYPDPRGRAAHEVLSEMVKLIGGDDNYSVAESNRDGYPAREIIIGKEGKASHVLVILRGDAIIQASVTGLSGTIPGEMSHKFLDSLMLKAPASQQATGPLEEGGLTRQPLNPLEYVEQSNLPHAVRGNDGQGLPQASPTSIETKVAESVEGRAAKIQSRMDEHMHPDAHSNFPDHYLSLSVGRESGDRQFYVDPGKLPVIGIDVALQQDPTGTAIRALAPVYHRQQAVVTTVLAPEGYAVGAINVNAGDAVHGIQLVFMRWTPKGFDTSTARNSEWIGIRPSSNVGARLGGDGRPVYGLWIRKSTFVHAIGLIRERY